MTAVVAACLCLLSACSKGSSPTPSPGGGAAETVTGRERIGWDQPATSAAELALLRYAIYVDGARNDLAEISCGSTGGTAGFPCSGRLPSMSVGAHTLQLAAYVDTAESARSAPFLVNVTGLTAGDPAPPNPLADGEIVTTDDGVRLRVDILAEGLDQPSAVAVTADGRALVGTAAGLVVVRDGEAPAPPEATDGQAVAIALSLAFDRDAQIYLTETVASANSALVFRTSRFREARGRLGERMVLLETGRASASPAAAMRFGPDGNLFLAFDDGGSATASQRMADWSGKLLRLAPDGRTPSDQPAATPVVFAGLTSPRGLDWNPDASGLWVADAVRDGTERLRVIAAPSQRPTSRGSRRGTFTLPKGFGAAAMSFYRGDAIPEFSGDLFVAGRDAGYLLRIRFDPGDPLTPGSTEPLLKNRAGSVRALAVAPDGAIYFCTTSQLIRLRPSTADGR